MRKLNEQWIEVIDGQEHMMKCIKVTRNPFPVEERFSDGYFFTNNKITDGEYSYYEIIKAKDLGILNKSGCLPDERTGLYPRIEEAKDNVQVFKWSCIVSSNDVYIRAYGSTKQQAIDAWNRRL